MSMFGFSRYETAVGVTASDVTIIQSKALLVGTGGALVVEPNQGGNTVTITVIAGQYIPLGVRRVLATGTVATGIIALN